MKTHYICYQQNPLDFWIGMINPLSDRLELTEHQSRFHSRAKATIEEIYWIEWQVIQEWLFYMPWDVYTRIWYVWKVEANWNTYVLLEWNDYSPTWIDDIICLDKMFNKILR